VDTTPHLQLDYDEEGEQRRREASRLIAMSGGSDAEGGFTSGNTTWKVTDDGYFYEPNNPLTKYAPGEMGEQSRMASTHGKGGREQSGPSWAKPNLRSRKEAEAPPEVEDAPAPAPGEFS
jgi:hypothetical protein